MSNHLLAAVVVLCAFGTVWHDLDGSTLTIYANTNDPVGPHLGRDWTVVYELPAGVNVLSATPGAACSDWDHFFWVTHGADPESCTIAAAAWAGPGAGTPLPPHTVVELATLEIDGLLVPEFVILADDLGGYHVCESPTSIVGPPPPSWSVIKALYR